MFHSYRMTSQEYSINTNGLDSQRDQPTVMGRISVYQLRLGTFSRSCPQSIPFHLPIPNAGSAPMHPVFQGKCLFEFWYCQERCNVTYVAAISTWKCCFHLGKSIYLPLLVAEDLPYGTRSTASVMLPSM